MEKDRIGVSDILREMREYAEHLRSLGTSRAVFAVSFCRWADALEVSMREPFAWWLDPGDPYGLGCYAQRFKPDEDAFRRWPNLTVTKLFALPPDAAGEIERLKHLCYTDADPEETEYADDYCAQVDERGGVILPASKEDKP
jgi:hypothetical protein